MKYAATRNETPIALWWRLALAKFEPRIQHIAVVENK